MSNALDYGRPTPPTIPSGTLSSVPLDVDIPEKHRILADAPVRTVPRSPGAVNFP